MTNPMLPRERCDYSAIVDRPPLTLPNGARLVLWPIVMIWAYVDVPAPREQRRTAP